MADIIKFNDRFYKAMDEEVSELDGCEYDDDVQVIDATSLSDLMDYFQAVYENMAKIADICGIFFPPECDDIETIRDLINGKE